MSLYQWPSLLPLPNVNFSGVVDQERIVTRMASGRIRQRLRSTQDRRTADVTFELTGSEYAIFVGVWKHRLNRGLDWFEMNLPTADNTALTLSECRFISDFRDQYVACDNWDVSASLEIKIKTLNDAELSVLLDEEELITNQPGSTSPTVNWDFDEV